LSKCGSESRNLLPTYSHSYFKFVPTLYFTTTWFNLWDQSRTCLFGFLCFNGVCGFLHVYSILVDRMFQVYVFVMFLYVSISRPCLSSRFIVHFMVYYLFLGIQMVLCFYGFMYLCLYLSLFPSIQKAFIQKLHHLFVVVYVSCIILLTCVTFSLVVLLIDVLHSKVVCE